MKKLLVHVALITFYKDTPQETRIKILRRFQKLAVRCGGDEAGIIGWSVVPALDLGKKNVSMIQLAAFKNVGAFQAFRTHPKHKQLRDELRECADWLDASGDYDTAQAKALMENIDSQ